MKIQDLKFHNLLLDPVGENHDNTIPYVPFDHFLKFHISNWSIIEFSANWTILQFWVTIFANNMPTSTLKNWSRQRLETNWTFQKIFEISLQSRIHLQRYFYNDFLTNRNILCFHDFFVLTCESDFEF